MHRFPKYFGLQGLCVRDLNRSKSHKIPTHLFNEVPVIKPKNKFINPSPLHLARINTLDTCYSDDEANKSAPKAFREPKAKFGTNVSSGISTPLNLLEEDNKETSKIKKKKSTSNEFNQKSILSFLQNKK